MRIPIKRPHKIPGTEEHHVFPGPFRAASEKYNCVVYLLPEDHRGSYSAHSNREFAEALKADYQGRLEAAGWTREEFIETFGRTYL